MPVPLPPGTGNRETSLARRPAIAFLAKHADPVAWKWCQMARDRITWTASRGCISTRSARSIRGSVRFISRSQRRSRRWQARISSRVGVGKASSRTPERAVRPTARKRRERRRLLPRTQAHLPGRKCGHQQVGGVMHFRVVDAQVAEHSLHGEFHDLLCVPHGDVLRIAGEGGAHLAPVLLSGRQ